MSLWLSGCSPSSGWDKNFGDPPSLTVWADGFRVKVTRAVECPSEAPYCGEIRPEKHMVCLLLPGHESPHLPCTRQLEQAGVRFTHISMVKAEAPRVLSSGGGYDIKNAQIIFMTPEGCS